MAMIPGATNGGPNGKERCPEGPQRIVCCDVIDLGWVEDSWAGGPPKKKHKCQLRWLSEHTMADGRMFLLSKRYTFSLHERAALRRDLNAWRGKPLSEDEAKTFDLEKLIGVNAYATVGHVPRSGDVYADIMAIMPLPKDMAKLTVPSTYVRGAVAAPAAAANPDEPPF